MVAPVWNVAEWGHTVAMEYLLLRALDDVVELILVLAESSFEELHPRTYDAASGMQYALHTPQLLFAPVRIVNVSSLLGV